MSIFSKNYSETLLPIVIDNLRGDVLTLHSCLLVSRDWSRVTGPIIWVDPFDHISQQTIQRRKAITPKLIDSYIACLPVEENTFLLTHGIDIPILQAPTFDYATYLEVLSESKLMEGFQIWEKHNRENRDADHLRYNTLELQIIGRTFIKMFLSRCKKLRVLAVTLYNTYSTYVSSVLPRLVDDEHMWSYIIRYQNKLRRFEVRMDQVKSSSPITNGHVQTLCHAIEVQKDLCEFAIYRLNTGVGKVVSSLLTGEFKYLKEVFFCQCDFAGVRSQDIADLASTLKTTAFLNCKNLEKDSLTAMAESMKYETKLWFDGTMWVKTYSEWKSTTDEKGFSLD